MKNYINEDCRLPQTKKCKNSLLHSKKIPLKYRTLLLICFIFSYYSEAKIRNTVKIQVQEFQKDTTRFVFNGTYLLHITQNFYFEDYTDTIELSLTPPSKFDFLRPFLYQDITFKTDNGLPLDYQYIANKLRFVLPKGCTKANLDFLFQSDYTMIGNKAMVGVATFVRNDDQSWYFISPDMYMDSVTAIIPKNLYFFPTQPFYKHNDSLYTTIQKDSLANLSFYLYDKYYYIEHSFSVDEIKVNLYLFKGVKINEGYSNEEYSLMDVKDIYLVQNWSNEDRIRKVENSIRFIGERLSLIFPKRECKLDIVESLMDITLGTDTLHWATSLRFSPSYAILLIDTADYNSNVVLHEIIHLYNDILPAKDDSAYFFFYEALTDYIARFLFYTNEQERDSAFMSLRDEYYTDTLNDDISIFEIKKIYANAEGGTYKIAFRKVPFLIYSFAKEVGEEKFTKILSEFFHHIGKTKEVNMNVLMKFCKKNGVTNKQWNEFVTKL